MDGKLLQGVTFAASHQLRAPHGCCQAFKEHFVPQIFLLLVTDSSGLASPHFPYNISECCFWESQRPSRSLGARYRPGPGMGVGLFLSSYCNGPSIPLCLSLPPPFSPSVFRSSLLSVFSGSLGERWAVGGFNCDALCDKWRKKIKTSEEAP